MNTIKKYPEVGDIVIKVGDDIRFLGQDATPEFIETQQAVGVVYFVCGNHVKIVGGINDTQQPWSCVADFEIETIPNATGDYAVTLQGKSVGNFHYTKTTGTKEEFVQQLNAWLPSVDNKFEAYMHNGVAVLQLSDCTAYSNTNTIAGCKLRKRVGEELSDVTSSMLLTQVKSNNLYSGMCRAKLLEWARNETQPNCNPTKRMDGVTKLFEIFPCSEAYYNGGLGDGLRANYPTYEAYIDACMARVWELDRGVMAHRDGKAICARLKDKKVLVRGEEKAAYSAVDWALAYDSGVPGFGKGTWWLPSMHELTLLMQDITLGTKRPLDKINTALGKKKGWSTISSASSCWSCCRCNVHFAWHFYSYGLANNGDFYYMWRVGAVSAFNLEF